MKKQINLRDGEYPTRLYHLKVLLSLFACPHSLFPFSFVHSQGRRNVRVKQVDVTVKSLNGGDVFILDANETIFQWNGAGASRMEKVPLFSPE